MEERLPEPDDIEVTRAQAYALLAALLARPPSEDLLRRLGHLAGGGTEWGDALVALAELARATDAAAVEREYNRLFIGLAQGELVPYASFYLTGFLHDRPLVQVREDLARLGLVRTAQTHEPEDHVAALLEIMAGLIDGRFGASSGRREQLDFFRRHLAGWAPRFFDDLARAASARFYRAVGGAGALLLEIEQDAFALPD